MKVSYTVPLYDTNSSVKKVLNIARYPPAVHSNKPLDRVQFAAALQADAWRDPAVGDQKIPSRFSEDSHSHITLLGPWQRLVLCPVFCLVPQPPSPGWSSSHSSSSASNVS